MDNYPNKQGQGCPECGAPAVDGLTCWEQLGMLLSWEYEDPELAAEHFLTVASYNLQHPAQFTGETLVWLRSSFIEYLDQGVSTEELRRRAGSAYAGSQRVLKDPADRHPVLRHWSMTIADVYLPARPQGAVERVRAWAITIRSAIVAE